MRRGCMTISPDREKRSRTGEEDETLVLRVWLTDYKTFRGTNWSPQAERLRADGLRDHADTQAYLADKIGESLGAEEGQARRQEAQSPLGCVSWIMNVAGWLVVQACRWRW